MNKLKGHTAFLSGPIDRCPNHGKLWREEITEFLHSLDIGSLNPCDKPIINIKYDEDANFVEKVNSLKIEGSWDEATRLMKNIVRADLSLVDRSDFLITHLNIDIFMCGSFTELTHAVQERKPVLIHCEQGKASVPNWLFGLCNHELFFDKWDDLKQYIKMVAYSDITEYNDLDGKWKFIDYNKVFGNG